MTDLFDFTPPTPLYAVMGNPVGHSLSPRIHTMFARQFDMELDYRLMHVDVGGFRQAVDGFRASGGQGANITVPFKLEAWELADRRTARAEIAGAVNTLTFRDDLISGDNTDGAGLCRDIIQNMGHAIRGRDVLVVGAGGAVRGVLAPLLDERPATLTVANRTVDKAESLAGVFAGHGRIEAGGFARLEGRRFDIVVNGTSASLKEEIPPLPDGLLRDRALAYDMMYGRERTVFLRWAAEHGAADLADGLGMLVEQAAGSFEVWHGRKPDTAPVIEKLRWSM